MSQIKIYALHKSFPSLSITGLKEPRQDSWFLGLLLSGSYLFLSLIVFCSFYFSFSSPSYGAQAGWHTSGIRGQLASSSFCSNELAIICFIECNQSLLRVPCPWPLPRLSIPLAHAPIRTRRKFKRIQTKHTKQSRTTRVAARFSSRKAPRRPRTHVFIYESVSMYVWSSCASGTQQSATDTHPP